MPGEKGAYRSVYSAIWDDPEFQAFDPLMMAVFFCLRTGPDCNYPCLYVFYRSSLPERIPKAAPDDLQRAFDRLVESGWIQYERPLLWIVKGLKNEPTFSPGNKNQEKGVVAMLKTLPKAPIINSFSQYYTLPYTLPPSPTDTHPPTHPKGMGKQGTGTGSGTGEGKGEGKSAREPRQPVDNFVPPGSAAFPGGLEAPRVASPGDNGEGKETTDVDPEILESQKRLIELRREQGIPEHGNAPHAQGRKK